MRVGMTPLPCNSFASGKVTSRPYSSVAILVLIGEIRFDPPNNSLSLSCPQSPSSNGISTTTKFKSYRLYQCNWLTAVELSAVYTQQCSKVQLRWAFWLKKRLKRATSGGLDETSGIFGMKIVRCMDLVNYQGSGQVERPQRAAKKTQSELGGFVAPLLLDTVQTKMI